MRRFLILFVVVFCWSGLASLAQSYTSRDNVTGDWEASETWDPAWVDPQHLIDGWDITINGTVTARDSIIFSGNASTLTVNDTLIIHNYLAIGSNNDLFIGDGGILIVYGNFKFGNQSIITADGYLVVTDSIIKQSSVLQGSSISNDDPARIFIGGIITLDALKGDTLDYPAFSCNGSNLAAYPNSGCSYGNFTDILEDPIYAYFDYLCASTNTATELAVCPGDSIRLFSSAGTKYNWSGPAGFSSSEQNPVLPDADTTMAGTYIITMTNEKRCTDTDTTSVAILPLPRVSITSASGSMCAGESRTLSGDPDGGEFGVIEGPGTLSGNILTSTGSGSITLEYVYSGTCTNSAAQAILVNDYPVPDGGPDQELKYVFETQMNAGLAPGDTGEWSLLAGTGSIDNVHSPTTYISDLSLGENIFQWKVRRDRCEADAEVRITVSGVFIPSAITPDGNGLNDYFVIGRNEENVELVILDRWGIRVYSNSNYRNDWDGRDNKGEPLPEGTYFYLVKVNGTEIYKGSVLIKR